MGDSDRDSSQAAQRRPRRRLSRPHLWVSTTYFAEGYPYTIINNLAEVLFQQLGASLRVIGLTSLFHLPWNLKFLWGPFLDRFETKRRWMLGVEVALTLMLLVLAFLVSVNQALGLIAACFTVLAVLAATHDIAIDGFYLEGLDEAGQSRFVGYRAMAYKIASLLVRGPLLVAIGYVGWAYGLLATAFAMLALTVAHVLILPRVESRQRPLGELLRGLVRPRLLVVGSVLALLIVLERELSWGRTAWEAVRGRVADAPVIGKVPAAGWIGIVLLVVLMALMALRRRWQRRATTSGSYYSAAFLAFLEQGKVGRILAFVVLFRAGESFLQKMKWPFLNQQVQLSLEQYGIVNGTLGVVASFIATLFGGWLIARHGLRRWIWPFVIMQNVLNVLYVALAMSAADGPPALSVVTLVITLEHFGEGLDAAVFMVYLMRCCDPGHKAAHMAILTALMSVSFTVAGAASGFVADAIGYTWYFGYCVLATLPGMALIPFLPYLDGRKPPADAGADGAATSSSPSSPSER